MRILKKTIWPHQIALTPPIDNVDEITAWLKERMPQDKWYVIGPNRFCFKTSQDATLFSLRWA
jgi:hypothetical protein